MAISQALIDEFGRPHLLDGTENAFIMSVATNLVDQSQSVQNASIDLQNLYVRQKIEPTKSSNTNTYIYLSNESTDDITVTTELRTQELSTDNGEVLSTYNFQVEGSTTTATKFQLPFNVDHLASASYYLVLKRTNVAGVKVWYNSAGGYVR